MDVPFISDSRTLCQNHSIRVPADWILASDNEDARMIIANYTWSANYMVLSNGYIYNTLYNDSNIILSKNQLSSISNDSYSCQYCNCQVLIRYKFLSSGRTSTTTSNNFNTNNSNKSKSSSNRLSAGGIAGITISVLLFGIGLSSLIIWRMGRLPKRSLGYNAKVYPTALQVQETEEEISLHPETPVHDLELEDAEELEHSTPRSISLCAVHPIG